MGKYYRINLGQLIEKYADKRAEEVVEAARALWDQEVLAMRKHEEKRKKREERKRVMEAGKETEEQVLNFLATGKLTREEIATCLKVPLRSVARIARSGKRR